MRRPFPAALWSVALLTAGLLAGCGPDSTTPTDPTTPTNPVNTYSVSGTVVLPGLPASAASLGVVTSSAAASVPNWSAPHVPGEVLILGSDTGTITTTLSSAGLRNVQVDAVSGSLQRVITPSGEDDAAFAARLAQAGLRVQPNYLYSALSVPNDPGYPSSTNAGIPIGNNAYDQDYLTRINAQAGWDELAAAGLQPVGAVTAVLDTGIDAGHPDLQGRLLPGYDFGDNDSNPAETTSGDVGHGTESAGIIGASTNNGIGLSGLTWSGQNVLPVKVFSNSGATTAALAKGIDYAVAQGAKVINMSLGITLAQLGGTPDPAVTASIQAAVGKNVVLVAAAGNTPDEGLYFPASDPNVLAVGALGQSDTLACYSARPKSGQKALDLVAPGGNAGTGTANCFSGSDYDILGLNARSVPNGSRSQNGYGLRAGTSESAPQVAGAASLLRAFRSDLSAAQIKGTLTGSAKAVAGGKLLDVGAAVRLAAALPGTSARAYSLSVQALQGTTVVKTFSANGTLAAGSSSAPYNVAGLSAGSYTLVASLKVSGQTYTGSSNVSVSANVADKTIAAQ
ncbi:S8 family peptidase [Deinococcus ruber]|uniref:Serine protease n=1 Tax=Deinococcus ruber TaxID=1848197 RepID=A0A918FBM1_9DEIO|nr:S8 family serine peptidase [Deinococcus ruber]GGR28024.1 serine protease [Deinococcus ruber]